jgi:hypothetical protein
VEVDLISMKELEDTLKIFGKIRKRENKYKIYKYGRILLKNRLFTLTEHVLGTVLYVFLKQETDQNDPAME